MIDEWINKIWYIHAVEYYLVLRRKLMHAAMWMNIEGIILNEISQPHTKK